MCSWRMEQPGRRGTARVLEMSPDDITAVPRTRQRDVEQTHVLRQLLAEGQFAMLLVILRAEVAHELRVTAIRTFMKENLFLAAPLQVGRLPGEGAEDHRIFEAL